MASPKVHDEHGKEASVLSVEDRLISLRDADAALRLEGLSVTPAVKAIGNKWARGEITAKELMAQTKAQVLAELKR